MSIKTTGFYDIHCKMGGKMVEFAGFKMPIQYAGILEEHKRVRNTVGVFDVSHMGEVEIRGKNALKMVDYLTINDATKIEINQAQYTAMCNENGGIVDDLIVYNRGDHYLLVINASNIEKDFQWMLSHKMNDVEITNVSDHYSQLAVQGKKAQETLQKLTDLDLSEIKFYWFIEGELAGVPMIISATGYTGEPGFELYFDKKHSEVVWEKVFEAGAEFDIAPIGLGARDSLRLEKKYCLYGNDIDENTLPLEAGLGWITKLEAGDFIGKDVLVKAKEAGIQKRLVGFEITGRMIPRKGYTIQKDGEEIGVITSGAFSPVLEKNIGLAYLKKGFTKAGTEIKIIAGKRTAPAIVVKTPFA